MISYVATYRIRYFLGNYLNTTEIARAVGMTKKIDYVIFRVWVKFLYKQAFFYLAEVISFSGLKNFETIPFHTMSFGFGVKSN